MKKILYTTSLVFLPSSFKRWIYGGNIMLYRISVTERGLTGIANIFRSRLSRLDDLLGAGTVPLILIRILIFFEKKIIKITNSNLWRNFYKNGGDAFNNSVFDNSIINPRLTGVSAERHWPGGGGRITPPRLTPKPMTAARRVRRRWKGLDETVLKHS